ncbi:hypothetical protein [Lutimonas vermicola]|uniref:Uncharacterized protein n=1 Tax=Lutimonas vermicola TaxID=414288 RepID=A0ABU9L5M4_9FLAO
MVNRERASKRKLAFFLERSETIIFLVFKRSLKGTLAEPMNPLQKNGYYILVESSLSFWSEAINSFFCFSQFTSLWLAQLEGNIDASQ